MSLLNNLANNETYSNSDVALLTNELNAIQESALRLENDIKYTAEMVPIIKLEGYDMGDKLTDLYVVENADFKRLLDSTEFDVKDGVDAILKQITAGEGKTWTSQVRDDIVKEFGIIVEKENHIALYEALISDASLMNTRCKAVREYVDYLNELNSLGVNIIIR